MINLIRPSRLNVNLPELEFEESSNALKVWGSKLLSMEVKGITSLRSMLVVVKLEA
jgi:hypothetical protein